LGRHDIDSRHLYRPRGIFKVYVAVLVFPVCLQESRVAMRRPYSRVHGESLSGCCLLLARSLSGFTAEPQGARLTQAERVSRAPAVHAQCANHHSFNINKNTQTATAALHYTPHSIRQTPEHTTSQYNNPCLLSIEPASVPCEAVVVLPVLCRS
jgi:hypothetical protein